MPSISQPVPFTEAFAREDESAVYSRAASLLVLGEQLSEDALAPHRDLSLRGAPEATELSDALPSEDLALLAVPSIRPSGERISRERLRGGVERDLALGADELRERSAALAELAVRLEEQPDLQGAAALFEASLRDRHELVRLTAAIGYMALAADPLPLQETVVAGTRSEDPLVRELAVTGLARFAPEHPRLRELETPTPSEDGGGRSDSLIVHGTFARSSSWWQPRGDFHSYLRQEIRPGLYSAADRFDWSGGYSDRARAAAAADLRAWVDERELQGLDLFCHSHGGNAAMLGTQGGLQAGTLVLLSCPAHPAKYFPDFDRVERVVSVRVRLDLVILLDRGGQRFRDSRIEEHVLPIWFDHAATHRPDVWRQYDVPAMV